MKVKKQFLLFIAGVVWTIAGINIVRIGIEAYAGYVTLWNLVLSAAVFMIFQHFVFGKLVKKHTGRILSYKDEWQWFLKFFDGKSFGIMAVMMGGGIGIRMSGLAPEQFIAVFYSGLGIALLTAGILFEVNFVKNQRKREMGG